MTRRKWTDEDLIDAVKTSISKAEIMKKLGLKVRPGNYETINKYIDKLGLDTSHILGQAHGTTKPRNERKLEDVLVENSDYNRKNLKRKLYKEGIKERKCELCGIGEEWYGKKMSLILDHINGIWNDNRLENLRIVCPNCNATLETHCGKHKQKKEPVKYYCTCGNEKHRTSKQCKECSAKNRTKIDWPSKDDLIKMVNKHGYSGAGRKLGVSDNAVKQRINKYGIVCF